MERKFSKKDEGFICAVCGKKVEKLNYTSRDHCPHCLCSLHVDINPGDRANDCKGILMPIAIDYNNSKGYIIEYQCVKCGKLHRNKCAEDDDFDIILKVSNGTYPYKNQILNLKD